MKGTGCGCPGGCEHGAKCGTVTPTGQGRHSDTTGRYFTEPTPEPPDHRMRSVERHYDVQTGTGYAYSTVTGWGRGTLYRAAMPALSLRSPGPMYDPTDPSTWRHQ